MNTTKKTTAVGVTALLVFVAFGTQVSTAAGIAFKNDLGPLQPVIVQGAKVEAVMLRSGQPLLIFPGRINWDNRLDVGVRLIVIYDANQPTRVLYRGPVQFLGQDLFFSIQYNAFGNIVLVPLPVMPQ